MITTIGIAIVLFATTNIDDIFVLIALFADPAFRTRHIVIGQYLGIGALVALSILASVLSVAVAPSYVGLLGFLPILMGLYYLVSRWMGASEDEDAPSSRPTGLASIVAVTFANGGDNIGVYTPVFSTNTALELVVTCLVFAVMIVVWLVSSRWLVSHPALGAPIRKYGPQVVPFVLIAIGCLVLYESGALSMFV